ncbi:MAG: hypothetical protein B0D92_06830 [Spirochaeta sp. LUC14_002_19_P3]|nr:MAG: hypothetical protein B0D92_06830 [Spirochaeta sp. LUC14_002_19_P3]
MKKYNTMLGKLTVGLGILFPITSALFVLSFCSKGKSNDIASYANPEAPAVSSAEMETAEEVVTEAEPEPNRYVKGNHTVAEGESFSLVTGMYWEDIYLWPDLYVLNNMISDDPDKIYPNEIIDIYNRLGQGNEYSERETEMILDAYMQVYDRFKSLGPHKNSSAWTLLWCGTKYNQDFLKLYERRIDSVDMEMAEKYIKEEGYLE